MAKKIKEVIEEEMEMVTNTVMELKEEAVEVVDFVEEKVEEIVTAVENFAAGVKVEVINFYVRALNGVKGTVIGEDEYGNTLIELEGGAKASFKADNLQKVE